MSHADSVLIPRFTFPSLITCTPSSTSSAPSLSLRDPTSATTHNEGRFGRLVKSQPLTGHEPNDLSESNDTEVTPIFFHRPSVPLTYSAESIATLPLDPNIDDERIRKMLASPLYLHGEKQVHTLPQVYHSYNENSVSSSEQISAGTGRPVALFSHKSKASQELHTDRDDRSLALRAVQGEMKHRLNTLNRKTRQEYFLKSKETRCSLRQKQKC